MSTPKLKLTYWNMSGGRGETARLALVVGGIPFEDHRISFSDWPALRGTTPFHACPILEVDGKTLSQSNTISRYVARLAKLYPEDVWQAALCDEMLDAVEDMWVQFGTTMGIKDQEKLKSAREELVSKYYNKYLDTMSKRLTEAGGQFFAANKLTIADLQVMIICRALGSGNFDHIPSDLVDTVAPNLNEHMKRVLELPEIAEYYKKLSVSK
jgi:glutathione S-transferase